jgi:uncharacterized lipoprotein YmbA
MKRSSISSRPRGLLAAVLWLPASALCLLLAGCSLVPAPTSDPTRFYVLSTSSSGSAGTVADGPSIHLRPIEVASYLRVRPMIIRRGENEVDFREYARWGEPLEQGVARVLREELLNRGAASAVQTGGLRGSEITAELAVRVLGCEGRADGTVNFRAVWELTPVGAATKPLAHGDFRAANLQWDGQNESSLAGGLSKAVSALADDIAGALTTAK